MERALEQQRLEFALGDVASLPSPRELADRLAQAEIGLFLGTAEIGSDLLATAWFLHSIGASSAALHLYGVDRRRQASQVAAHIFDLSLASNEFDYVDRLQMLFAAQLSYMLGDQDPNATALLHRETLHESRLLSHPGLACLEIACLLLALDRERLVSRLKGDIADDVAALRGDSEPMSLGDTTYAAAFGVMRAAYRVVQHLSFNRPERMDNAIQFLSQAVTSKGDLTSRWVAANLRDYAERLTETSIWSVLPDDADAVGQAMTLGAPPVMHLWPPQVRLLRATPSPLDEDVARAILSYPTSAGKTLVSQLISLLHVARGGSVCMVVPSHSLARELRRDLESRAQLLERPVVDGGPIGWDLPADDRPRVVVVTPEKLSAVLRRDPERVLDEFSLFVFDEAHLVGDSQRGWNIETLISYLHWQTVSTGHRIILLSAALGNQAHFGAWLKLNSSSPLLAHEDWRGPRRVHGIFTTVRTEPYEAVVPGRENALPRRRASLHGRITVRTSSDGSHTHLTTVEPVGELTQVLREGRWKRDGPRSTQNYRMRAVAAALLGELGGVLVVEGTKANVQRFAQALADLLRPADATADLAAFVSSRLGPDHPLVSTVRRGVGFHHAALPDDVQAELEDAMRTGKLNYIVATTTLVEGINFPVKSVLVGSRGYPTRDGFVETIDAAKLLNAIGRAGRAGRETEGWVVLALEQRFDAMLFGELDRDDESLAIKSQLAVDGALDDLARFEEAERAGQDAVLRGTGGVIDSFISYVWFIAAESERLQVSQPDAVAGAVSSTLGWQQLDDGVKERWSAVATRALSIFDTEPVHRRRRWARSGMTIPSASTLETIVAQARLRLSPVTGPTEPTLAFDAIWDEESFQMLLELPESGFKPFKARVGDRRTEALEVDVLGIARGWLMGMSTADIAGLYLSEVGNDDYRFEQLSEFRRGVLQHLLPWVTGIVLDWLNAGRDADRYPLSLDLSAYIRYGVPHLCSMQLMAQGVRSRRVALAIGEASPNIDSAIASLRNQSLSEWSLGFGASQSETDDLLSVVEVPRGSAVAAVMGGGVWRCPVRLRGVPSATEGSATASIRPSSEGPQEMRVEVDSVEVAVVPPGYQRQLELLLGSGLPLDVQLVNTSTSAELVVGAPQFEDSPSWD